MANPFAIFAAGVFGKEGPARLLKGLCPRCGCDPMKEGFREEISEKEFGISGLCQSCQDDIFASKED